MTSRLKASLRLVLMPLFFLFITSSTGRGEDFCIGSVTDLYIYLEEAQSNSQEDTIRIQQGFYYGSFNFHSTQPYSLSISGGYTENCSSKIDDETLTILDAGKNAPVLWVYSSGPVYIDNLTVQNGKTNESMWSNGGAGIRVTGSEVVEVEHCTFKFNEGNTALWTGVSTITNCTFDNNSGGAIGGSSQLLVKNIKHNIIKDNLTYGIYMANGNLLIDSNIIINNGYGIVVQERGREVTIRSNVISNNIELGIYYEPENENITFNLINNTIVNNGATSYGLQDESAALIVVGSTELSTLNFYNNVFIKNGSSDSNEIYINNDGEGDGFPCIVNAFNNFLTESGKILVELPLWVEIGPSNITGNDPKFENMAMGDYHLRAGSPCLDQGSNSAPELPSEDMDGHPRIIHGTVDMGAYELTVPSVDFSPDKLRGDVPLTVSFSSIIFGDVNSFAWSFGDGGMSTESNPSHIFTNPGSYTVALTVTGPDGMDTETKTNYIAAMEPFPLELLLPAIAGAKQKRGF